MASAGAAGRDGGCGIAPAVASAAPPTPVSTTHCGGPLTIDPSPTTDDPYLVDYYFHCSEDITAYTLIVNRRVSDFGAVDDFDPSPPVVQSDGTPSTTQSVSARPIRRAMGSTATRARAASSARGATSTGRSRLDLTKACAKVADYVPFPKVKTKTTKPKTTKPKKPQKTKKSKKTTKAKTTARKASRRS